MTASVCAQAPLALTAHVIAWSLMLQLLVGAGLGWLLARRRFAGRQLVDALVSLPLVFPPIVLGYGLLVLLGRQGLVIQMLPAVLLPDIVFSQTGLVIAAFIAGLPLMVKPTQAAFAGTSPRLLEAAAMLGHRPWSVFWRIELPLARRGIAAGLILSGGRALGEVGLSLMLGGNIIGRTETLSLAIYNNVLDGNLACANQLSLMLGVLAMAAFMVLRRFGAL